MTIAQATCATCGTPFARKRTAQRTCSTACKQALFRAEKCNAGHHDTEEPQDLAEASATPALQRMYPGLKPLSEIECKVLRLEPAGLCDRTGALLYRRPETNDPATAPTVPGHGSTNPMEGN